MAPKFGIEEGSVQDQLSFLTPELRMRYRRNRIKYQADIASIERWGRAGCTSGLPNLYEEEE